MIGNEFLDALPVRQFVRVGGQWRERVVRLNDEGGLAFDVAAAHEPYIRGNARDGEVLEVNPAGHRCMFELGSRLAEAGRRRAVDRLWPCGHRRRRHAPGLRAHRYVDPLATPGECDLTAHVDFAAMARSAAATGAAVYGPIDQGDFLRAIGIDLRPRRLPSARRRSAARS